MAFLLSSFCSSRWHGLLPDANTRAVTLAGGWLGAVLVVELIEQSIPQPLDLPPELSHVQRFILRLQSLSRRGRDLARLDQTLVRCLRLILLAADFSALTHLLGQLHGGLKEVLIHREAPIQLLQDRQLNVAVQPPVAYHLPYVRPVPLFHPGIVVLLVGARSRHPDPRLLTVTPEQPVDHAAIVVRVDLQNAKGQPPPDPVHPFLRRHPLAP